MVIIICISCYFYCTIYRPKQPLYDINIKLGEIRFCKYIFNMKINFELAKNDIRNRTCSTCSNLPFSTGLDIL